MSKRKTDFFEKPFMKVLLTLVSTVLSTLVLAFSALTILQIYEKTPEEASKFLIWVFMAVALLSIVSFLKDHSKLNFIRCVILFVFNIILGVVSLSGNTYNPQVFQITAGLYCLTIVISRIFALIKRHDLRSIILNGLIIAFAVVLAIGIFTTPAEENVVTIVTLECVFIAAVSFIEAAMIIFATLKVKVLFKIIVSTFSLEILFGLLTTIICFSIVLQTVEPGITNFPDALWYSFAVVTTIGFGDFTAVTPLGRVLTVILGLYGIIAVAVITSIIVNFYNETSGRRDQKELREISKEEKNK